MLAGLALGATVSGCGGGPYEGSASGWPNASRNFATAPLPGNPSPTATPAPEDGAIRSHYLNMPNFPGAAEWVRVHLVAGQKSFNLAVDGSVEVFDEDNGSIEIRDRIASAPVTVTGASLAIGSRIYFGQDRIELRPQPGTRMAVNGEDLGPAVQLLTIYRNQGERTVQCVASWDLERYLEGVVAGEVPVDWPAEALKAQAVASRTYVLFQMQDRRYEPWDVERTVHSQVFKTGDREKIDPRVTAAVEATRGEYLTSAGALFPAFFHSTSGGETCSAQEAFGPQASDAPALRGHVQDSFGTASSLYRWERKFSLATFQERLAKKGLWKPADGNRILDIQPVGVPAAGGLRATVYLVIGVKDRRYIPANDFRLAFGGGRDDLPSTLVFAWKVAHGSVTIDGGGWGHGVGMCQFGALGRANAGQTYRQILAAYYPGSDLQSIGPTAAAVPVVAFRP